MTDGNASVALATSQQACPLRDGVVDMEKLSAAESRTLAFEILRSVYLITGAKAASLMLPHPMVRKLTSQLIDALVERGHCDLVTARPDWPSGLVGIDSLPLIFPAEAYAAR